jgi:serine/threonine-protein kinase
MSQMPETADRLNAALEGRYRIERELGAGGMATVYLAEDIKHKRNVAIKVLRPELAAVIGGERFLSEIQTTANLQHPHILPLFDSGEAEGFLYYVMPFIDGETLREKLDREKQLSVDEAVRIAGDVADALDYAHRNGVIHRDIKPANILLHDGRPVVADFGIAVAVSAAGGGRMTETGLSLGTPHYMSPEQASADRDLSARSDVYSLGCVLYEMIAGQPPHTGPSAQSVLVRIMTEAPRSLTELRHTVPPHVAAVVAKAVEKLPADRFEGAKEFKEALGDSAFEYQASERSTGRSTAAVAAPVAPPAPSRARWLPWVVAGAAVVLAALGWNRSEPDGPVHRLGLLLDSVGTEFGPSMALSPDGSRIVYVGRDGGLWVRPFQTLESRRLPQTDDARTPFFSPDGDRVGFHRGGPGGAQFFSVSLSGAPPVQLAAGEFYPGGTWSEDGYVYFADGPGSTLLRVRGQGGIVETVADSSSGYEFTWPEALPGGRIVLATGWGTRQNGSGIVAVDPETGTVTPILTELSGAQLPDMVRSARDYLIWITQDRTLMAAPFDQDALELTGAPAALASGVLRVAPRAGDFDIAEDGTLTYSVGASAISGLGETMGWVDRQGTATVIDERLAEDVGDFDYLSLSPNGRLIAAEIQSEPDGAATEEHHVWIYDLEQQTLVRLTLQGENNIQPQWLDDATVAYLSDQGDGPMALYSQAIDAPESESVLYSADRQILDFAVRAPGEPLAVSLAGGPGDAPEVWAVDPSGGGEPLPIASTRFAEWGVALSPDGRWVAYTSDESGRDEVYIRPFPTGGTRYAVSTTGGSSARWSRSGNELFYVGGDGQVMVASLDLGDGIQVRSRSALFSVTPFELPGPAATYDVDAEGEGFLVILEAGGSASGDRVLVLNLFEELDRLTRGRD